MVPVLVGVGIAIVAFLVGGTVVALNWDEIVIRWSGKKVAVLGARDVGKTHLIKFLTTGSIPSEYKQTVGADKVSSKRLSMKELDLKLKETLDLSGDKASYGEWKELHDKSDIIFYLLRADRLLVGDPVVEARVRDDLRHIAGWLAARPPRPEFFIVGTHCDLDENFRNLKPENVGDYADRFRKLAVVSELVSRAGGTQQVKVVLGSMKTEQDTEALAYQIFAQVKK